MMMYEMVKSIKIKQLDGLGQDCGNPMANAQELQQSCTKPSYWYMGASG